MEDIPLFGNESAPHKTKDENLYYSDEEIVSRGKTTRKYLYVLSALVIVSAGVFGYLAYNGYVNDVTMSQQLSDLSISMESSFAVLTGRIEALGRRVTGLEEKTDQLEEGISENKENIEKTQKEVESVKESQETLKITSEDAKNIALNWVAANIQGITVPHRQWDFNQGEYTIKEFEVDNTSDAKRIKEEIISVEKTEDGHVVRMLLTFKGFHFTNDKLHWEVSILVDTKGIATQKYIKFAY